MTTFFLHTQPQRRDRSIHNSARVSDQIVGTETRQLTSLAGDAFVRELDFSKIQIRLKEKHDKKGENDEEDTIAKLNGDTLDVLRKCLVCISPSASGRD